MEENTGGFQPLIQDNSDFYYLDEEAEEDILVLIDYNESFGVQMDRVYY